MEHDDASSGGEVSARELLHQLVERLPSDTLPGVARYLESVCAGAPPEAPEDADPLAPETEAMIAASRAAVAAGAVLTQEQLQARRAARRETA